MSTGRLKKQRKHSKFNFARYFQVLGISLCVVLICAIASMFIIKPNIKTNNSSSAPVSAIDGDKINILLMCADNDGLLTDSIMIASFDTKTSELNMLSIPRDTRIFVGNRMQKINAAHAYDNAGAAGTVEAVQRLTGIPINYYVDLTFGVIERCVDVLGPVEFEIPDLYNDGVGMVYDDPFQDLHINLKPGLQKLNGKQVVHLLRYRKGNEDANGIRNTYLRGDLDRIDIQKQFIKTFVDQKLNASLILKIPSLFKELSKGFETNLTAAEVIKYRKLLNGFTSANIQAYTVPGEDGYVDEDGVSVSYFVPNLDELRTLINDSFGYDASEITVEKKFESKATQAPKKSDETAEKNTDGSNESSAQSSSASSNTESSGNSTSESSSNSSSSSSASSSASGSNSSQNSTSQSSQASGQNNDSSSSSSINYSGGSDSLVETSELD